ncbi:MAG: molybdopterin-binding protein [Sedimentisphaerales bacterium]
MSNKGKVISVNVSAEKGTIKKPVPEILIGKNGVVNDAHAGKWHRQVSLLSQEDIEVFGMSIGRQISPGEFAENITIEGLDLNEVFILDRLRLNEAELEVTQIGKECHGDACAVFQQTGKCVMPKKGIFCRVIKPGMIKPGDAIEYFPKQLTFLIITLSDRASAGEYEDRSGPRAKQILQEYFADKKWHCQFNNVLLIDDAGKLREELSKAIKKDVDVIFTLGSTGIGPRDIAPETIISVCDKVIPGIMENIRIKYGNNKPSALLSRSIAAIAGDTQIYALPGSAKAVEEYLTEILINMEHAVFMLHGLDIH